MLGVLEISFLAGLLGGAVRGLVGLSKTILKEKQTFKPYRFVMFIMVSGLIGAVAGILIEADWRIAVLAGYAGTDLIESLVKIKLLKGMKP